ncbi:hypothetical protein B0H14DRAFT_1648391 [Mycena olivaceomarginata]|nr:hypothetical protein B0H14DRAFT_1648391 [Mycena olivaceomarginata]
MQTYCRGMQRAVLPVRGFLSPRSSVPALPSLSHLFSPRSFPAGRPPSSLLPSSPLPAPRLWALPPRVLVHTISAFDSIPQIMWLCAPKTNAHSMRPYSRPRSTSTAGSASAYNNGFARARQGARGGRAGSLHRIARAGGSACVRCGVVRSRMPHA